MANALTTALLFRTLVMLASLPGAVFLPEILLQPGQSGETAEVLSLPAPILPTFRRKLWG